MTEKSSVRSRLLRKHPNNRVGFMPQTIYDIAGMPLGWEEMEPLQRIPGKISCYFEKSLIKEIRRFRINNDYSKNQYFMKLSDDTFVEVLY